MNASPSHFTISSRTGGELARAVKEGLNLEDPNARWRDESPVELVAGRDFDRVVLGIPIAALKTICPPLVGHPRLAGRWRPMLEGIATTATQAYQLWCRGDLKDFGWRDPRPIFGMYEDPVDPYVDTTESWRPSSRMKATSGRPHRNQAGRAARNRVSCSQTGGRRLMHRNRQRPA